MRNRIFERENQKELEELAKRNQSQAALPLSEELRGCCDIREYLSIILSTGTKYSLSHTSLFSRWYLPPSSYKAFYGSFPSGVGWDAWCSMKKNPAVTESRAANKIL